MLANFKLLPPFLQFFSLLARFLLTMCHQNHLLPINVLQTYFFQIMFISLKVLYNVHADVYHRWLAKNYPIEPRVLGGLKQTMLSSDVCPILTYIYHQLFRRDCSISQRVLQVVHA